MAEKLFIKKRQKDRRKHTFMTVKLILRLVVASVLLMLGVLYFFGDTGSDACVNGCEGQYSLTTWVLAFLMIFGVVIVLGGLTGALIAYMRRNRSSGSLTSLISEEREQD